MFYYVAIQIHEKGSVTSKPRILLIALSTDHGLI